MLNLTKWKAIVGALLLTIGSVSAETPNSFQPGMKVCMSAGYILGLDDYAPDAISLMNVKIHYQFNPYFSLGGTAGGSMFYDMFKDDNTPGFINITTDAQGILPVSKKVSLFGEVGFGVGIGISNIDTNYLLRVGPGIIMGPVALSALYNKFGEYEAMLFQIGYRF